MVGQVIAGKGWLTYLLTEQSSCRRNWTSLGIFSRAGHISNESARNDSTRLTSNILGCDPFSIGVLNGLAYLCQNIYPRGYDQSCEPIVLSLCREYNESASPLGTTALLIGRIEFRCKLSVVDADGLIVLTRLKGFPP
jgi:hypothetical protein